MQAQQITKHTVKDIYALPDGQRAELIDGDMYMMSPPGLTHQRIVSQLVKKIGNHIDSQHGEREVFPAPFAVFLNADSHTYVEPDLSVICDKSKLDDRGCNGAPDWVIEVVSPSSQRMDYMIKLFKYRDAGVREYWIVNPKTKTIQSYFWDGEEDSAQFAFTDDVPVHIYDGWIVNIAELLK
ncbi:Uma2 family endonuclease [Clostridiales bacterium]|nr:Uma2 family endonuclease [Clostridiales bacterium]